MTHDLHEALTQAANVGRASFEETDAATVIAPTARRVRRHRAAVTAFAAMGSVVMLAGVLWASDAVRWHGTDTLVPAVSAEPSFGADSPLGDTPWSTLALAAVASPRTMGEQRADSAAGMICHHDKPTDDPRVAVTQHSDVTANAVSYEDCTAVWFKKGPLTTDSNAGAAAADGDTAFGAQSLIRNVSDRPLSIDRAAIFMWIETDPGTLNDSAIATYSRAVIGKSMWPVAGHNNALLESADAPIVIDPGTYYNATGVVRGLGDDGMLPELISSGAAYTVTFWARIHEESANGDATYLVQLGSAHTYGGARN